MCCIVSWIEWKGADSFTWRSVNGEVASRIEGHESNEDEYHSHYVRSHVPDEVRGPENPHWSACHHLHLKRGSYVYKKLLEDKSITNKYNHIKDQK